MSGPRCPQTHLVEALHDGRLGAAEVGSVRRHLAGCEACRDWLRDLEAIRGTLRASAEQPTPLQHQRARAALLRAAARPPRRRTVGRPLWLVLAGVGVAATAVAGSGAWRALWEPVAEPEPPPASRDLAAAMEALGAGDFGSAAQQFAAFLSAHPSDPRAEEVAYLIAIAHERAGRTEQARAAARRYLAAWPEGAYRRRAAKIAAIPGNE